MAQLSAASTEEEIKNNAILTLHSYKCEWNGCEAVLNCWKHLEKHYHLHCQWVQTADRTCGLRFCTLDKKRRITLSSLKDHVNKAHLSRAHVPCPVSDCDNTELPGRIYDHFVDNHAHQTRMALAPQSCPFPPKPLPNPLPMLPNKPAYIHEIMPLTKGKFKKVRRVGKEKRPLTVWSYFEYAERPSARELSIMKRHDIAFKPLVRPDLPSKTTPWPKFILKTRTIPRERIQMSMPPMPASTSSPQELPEKPPTFTYPAFKKYMERS